MLKYILVILFSFNYIVCNVVEVPDLGSVNGLVTRTAWSQRNINEFRGIPYAEAPEGDLRFKYPVKITTWGDETYEAVNFGPACPQPPMNSSSKLRELSNSILKPAKWAEEQQMKSKANGITCLVLDVYTPTLNASADLPVVVFFHGGEYVIGSSAAYGPGYLLEHDIVLVVPQYRLGPFGYFYLNDPEAPGNMGLADQAMALRWVRDNIKYFGGNPSMITAFGSEAGAASVSLHMLNVSFTSETSRLFDRVIATGGSALSIWGINTKSDHAITMSKKLAAKAGCNRTTNQEITDCMESLSEDDLVNAYVEHQLGEVKKGLIGGAGSVPVIQSGQENVELMVRYRPQDVLEKENFDENGVEREDYLGLPMLVGATEHEGIYALDLIYPYYILENNYVNDSLFLKNELVAAILNSYGVNETSRVMADACQRRYFNRTTLGDFEQMIPGLIDYLGVAYFKGSVFRQADLASLRDKVFLFSFEYFGQHSLRHSYNHDLTLAGGVSHADDLIYLFPNENYPLSGLDQTVAKRLVDTYANFIKYGDPTPEGETDENIPIWLAWSRAESNYMHIEDRFMTKRGYRNTFTTARKNGLIAPKYAAANSLIIFNLLLLVSALLAYIM